MNCWRTRCSARRLSDGSVEVVRFSRKFSKILNVSRSANGAKMLRYSNVRVNSDGTAVMMMILQDRHTDTDLSAQLCGDAAALYKLTPTVDSFSLTWVCFILKLPSVLFHFSRYREKQK